MLEEVHSAESTLTKPQNNASQKYHHNHRVTVAVAITILLHYCCCHCQRYCHYCHIITLTIIIIISIIMIYHSMFKPQQHSWSPPCTPKYEQAGGFSWLDTSPPLPSPWDGNGLLGIKASQCDHAMVIVVVVFAYLMSQQHASIFQGLNCSGKCTCCHAEIEVARQTSYLNQSQCTDTRQTSSSTDPITPGRVATGVLISKSLVWLDLMARTVCDGGGS